VANQGDFIIMAHTSNQDQIIYSKCSV